MRPTYDDTNIFARILRGEIPNDTVAESAHSLAFRDIRPQAPVHVLVIPKGAYVDLQDFADHASEAEIVDFMRMVAKVSKEEGLTPGEDAGGFRAIANAGPDGRQEVQHLHLHLVGGRNMGHMLSRS